VDGRVRDDVSTVAKLGGTCLPCSCENLSCNHVENLIAVLVFQFFVATDYFYGLVENW